MRVYISGMWSTCNM